MNDLILYTTEDGRSQIQRTLTRYNLDAILAVGYEPITTSRLPHQRPPRYRPV